MASSRRTPRGVLPVSLTVTAYLSVPSTSTSMPRTVARASTFISSIPAPTQATSTSRVVLRGARLSPQVMLMRTAMDTALTALELLLARSTASPRRLTSRLSRSCAPTDPAPCLMSSRASSMPPSHTASRSPSPRRARERASVALPPI